MQYEILKFKTMDELVTAVNNAIKDGWKPQGGVCYQDGLYFGCAQAMIKE